MKNTILVFVFLLIAGNSQAGEGWPLKCNKKITIGSNSSIITLFYLMIYPDKKKAEQTWFHSKTTIHGTMTTTKNTYFLKFDKPQKNIPHYAREIKIDRASGYYSMKKNGNPKDIYVHGHCDSYTNRF